MPTANVSGSFTGTGWTINVTATDLDTDLTIIDFLPFFAGSPIVVAGNFVKTSPTVLTYIGASLLVSTSVVIQRRTPPGQRTVIGFASRFSSDVWNKEVDRRVRLSEEYALNGIGPGSVVVAPIPQNSAYPSGWSGDTTFSATRNSLFNIITTLATSASPTFTGVVTVPTEIAGSNNTRASSTAFVTTALASYALLASPSFTGSPTALTPPQGDNSTRLANTNFVQLLDRGSAGGRLTSTTGTPVPTAGVTSITSVFYTPFIHNYIRLWNGTQWVNVAFNELTLSLAGLTINTNYDVFITNVTSPVLSAVAWTNNTTRALAVSLLNGTVVMTSDNTRRLVGTIRTTGTIGQSQDTDARRYVANVENKVSRRVARNFAGAAYVYATAAWRQTNASALEQVEFIHCLAGNDVSVTKFCQVALGNTNTQAYIAIGLDAVYTISNLNSGTTTIANMHSAGTNFLTGSNDFIADGLSAGYHFLTSCEFGAAGATFSGNSTDVVLNSLHGFVTM